MHEFLSLDELTAFNYNQHHGFNGEASPPRRVRGFFVAQGGSAGPGYAFIADHIAAQPAATGGFSC
ncbi:hypothetical protein INF35_10025 [Subdoligranulum sp. DSM 109015]|uniref:Uncharacterized protein n=1 Tax=Gemmiger gallinarum TaxID=2779354 RepID=A0ABR9R4N9_9FIRM|nr:hypothetical protein [Gemmiger gallinarum]